MHGPRGLRCPSPHVRAHAFTHISAHTRTLTRPARAGGPAPSAGGSSPPGASVPPTAGRSGPSLPLPLCGLRGPRALADPPRSGSPASPLRALADPGGPRRALPPGHHPRLAPVPWGGRLVTWPFPTSGDRVPCRPSSGCTQTAGPWAAPRPAAPGLLCLGLGLPCPEVSIDRHFQARPVRPRDSTWEGAGPRRRKE